MPPTTPPEVTPAQRLEAHRLLAQGVNQVLAKPPATRTELDLSILRAFALMQVSNALDALRDAVNALDIGGAPIAALVLQGVGAQICQVVPLIPGPQQIVPADINGASPSAGVN